jgi:hypothetical protein
MVMSPQVFLKLMGLSPLASNKEQHRFGCISGGSDRRDYGPGSRPGMRGRNEGHISGA